MQGPSFRGTVNPSTADGSQITATFTGYVGGTRDSQTSVTTTVTKPPQVIAIYPNDNPDPVVAGNKVTYSTWINNLGDLYVNGVSVSANLPSELTNLEYSTNGQNWQSYNSGDPILFGNLFPYVYIQGPSFRGTVNPSTPSGTILTATFIGLVGGTQNTQTSTTTTVTKPPQILDLNVYDSPDPVAAGGQLTYNTWITNNGEDAASFTVSANLPSELTNKEYYDVNSQSWLPYTSGQQIGTGYINPGWNVAGPSFRGTVSPSTLSGSITGTFIGYVSGTPNVQTMATTTVTANNAPIANAGGPYYGKEGSPILFNAGESYDPDGDPIYFRWDFNNDGIWDTDYSISPLSSHTWRDDYTGTVVVEVSDDQVTSTATALVTVENVPPTATIDTSYYVKVPITMRVAGQPTNSVEIQIIQDGQVIASGKIVRTPGSSNEQDITIYANIDLSKPYTGKLIFDTGDVKSGSTPVWLIIDGKKTKIATFNTNKNNPATYQQTIEFPLAGMFTTVGKEITFKAQASDPGTDDLTLTWNFGDGTQPITHSYTSNGIDIITDTATHIYTQAGTYTITLIVRDDDGGVETVTKTITIS